MAEYYGHDLSDDEADEIAIKLFDRSLFSPEASLIESKWFDYRYLNPLKATAWFIHEYKRAHVWMMHKRFDCRVERNGFKKHATIWDLPSRELQALWRARQTADRLGVPYDFFCVSAMIYGETTLWTRLPRPNQLRIAKIVDYISEMWLESKKHGLRFAEDDGFKSLSGIKEPDHREDYRTYLLELVSYRRGKNYLVSQLVSDGILNKDDVLEMWGQELLDRLVLIDLNQPA